MITRTECYEIRCDGGCDDHGWDEGIAHYPSQQEAIETARSYGWTITGARALCPNCTRDAECAATSHQWGDWQDSTRTVAGMRYRSRYCEHCSASETDPPFQALVALHEAAEVVGEALNGDDR